MTPTEYDSTTEEILEILRHAFSALHSQLVQEHLPDVGTAVLNSANVISEKRLGKLDRLLREKPHASLLSLEAMVLFSNNKIIKWLNSKPAEEVQCSKC